ncbi:hypothetical protein PM082_020925 [Marasmius tenuissimus]|nr:hypothetical protein PM082_020925 [Marasmius tenuissimus]
MIRATQTVASLALGRNSKRPYEPEDPSPKTISAESAVNSRATKRRRTDSGYSSVSGSSSSPRAIPHDSISATSVPTSSALLPPDVHRVGLEPQSIGLWISELLNDRFSASHRVSENDSFLDESSMKTLCDLLIEMLDVLNPSNNTIFAGLIYFERLMRSISLRCSDCQTERFDLAKRTFLVSLNLAFVWLDDAPWTLSAIAEWMDLSLSEAKKWEIEALVVLEYNLAISANMWLYWLDALQAHAVDINFQPNVAEAISDIFYNAREDVLETELAKERFFARVPPPAPAPPLVTPPSPKPESSRPRLTLADELEPHPAYMHTPYPDTIPGTPDEPNSPESCYSSDGSDGSPQAQARRRSIHDLTVPMARSTGLEHEIWDWYEEDIVCSVQQPQPVYPSYHYYLLSAAA